MNKNVFIYSDEGTDKTGIASIEGNCRKRLKLPYRQIKSEDIIEDVLQGKNIFVMPGGADLPYCKKLNGIGNEKIRKFIEDGGFYIGICAGAYYACKRINFKGKDYDVSGDRELGLFEGTAEGSLPFLTDGNYFRDSGTKSKAMISLKFKEKLSEEYFERFFSTYPLILRHLDAEELVLIEKNAEELGIEISDNIKYDIGYSLTNTQTEIMTEEEKEAIEEIRKKWNLKKVYED